MVVTPDEIRERVLDLPPLADVMDEGDMQQTDVFKPGQPAPDAPGMPGKPPPPLPPGFEAGPGSPFPPKAGAPQKAKPKAGGPTGKAAPEPKKGRPQPRTAASDRPRRAFAWPPKH